jgi:hypothetical protein
MLPEFPNAPATFAAVAVTGKRGLEVSSPHVEISGKK